MILIGQLDRTSLARLYSNADVFIHPNPREPFGNVGLEALASGAACVFPNSGGVLTYADHSNSWVVKPDAEGFYMGIKEAVDDEQLRRSKTENAIETAARNSEDAAIDRLVGTYDRFFRSFSTRQTTEFRNSRDANLNVHGLHRKV
jgi:glycosyltransferase involved in cell wall biosynthesis